MPNAALLLADILADWDVPQNQSVLATRNFGNDSGEASFWAELTRVLTLVGEVEQGIRDLRAVGDKIADVVDALVPGLYRFILPVDRAWHASGGGAPATKLDPNLLALLRVLGHHLETVSLPDAARTAEEIEQVRNALDAAKDRVIKSELTTELKRYLIGLISEALRCLDETDAVGEQRLRNRVFTLVGAFETVAVNEDAEHPGENKGEGWRQAARGIVKAVLVNMITKTLAWGATTAIGS